jgi:hypothetical protein
MAAAPANGALGHAVTYVGVMTSLA